ALDSGQCVPTTCANAGGNYCGIVGDGCGGQLNCGACPAGQACGGAGRTNVCGYTPDGGCTALTCNQAGGQYCGVVGNGCGGTMDCGACQNGLSCGGGGLPSVCGGAPDAGNCPTPTSCTHAGGNYCGTVGNGCGGTMDCGPCPAGLTCGGAGTPSICGTSPDSGGCNNPITTCTQAGGTYCGTIGNNCGGTLDCGACTGMATCGGGGVTNVCGHAPDAGTCTALTCTPQNGRYCGSVGNGCGGIMDCGACPAGDTCGASIPNVCSRTPGTCTPITCQQLGGKYCGTVGDGCGGQLDCGGCPTGLSCGGAGTPNICGALPDAGTCTTPIACQQTNGKYCGTIGNGCGGTQDCGGCPAGQTCGARTPNVCNKPCPLCAQIPTCEAGTTTVTGTVVSGALTNPDPIYGALVYIPNVALGTVFPPLSSGPSCDRCTPLNPDDSIAAAVTGPSGQFTLTGVPAGTGIPLIVQLGKWRRQLTINVTACTNNALPAGTVRLPRNKTEGDIPLTAISTGRVDTLECL